MMTEAKDTTYQGWTNHATWCVKLHADNTQEWHEHLRTLTAIIIRQAPTCEQVTEGIWTVAEAERILLANMVQGWAEETLGIECESNDATALFRVDMLKGYLDDVNWREIAEALLDAARE